MADRTIVLVPYKIDEKGTIYIKPMARSKHKGYVARMKRLVAMGVFAKEILEIKKACNPVLQVNSIVKEVV